MDQEEWEARTAMDLFGSRNATLKERDRKKVFTLDKGAFYTLVYIYRILGPPPHRVQITNISEHLRTTQNGPRRSRF